MHPRVQFCIGALFHPDRRFGIGPGGNATARTGRSILGPAQPNPASLEAAGSKNAAAMQHAST
eukprot:119570-Alexandrium_andersonii.AAC.1